MIRHRDSFSDRFLERLAVGTVAAFVGVGAVAPVGAAPAADLVVWPRDAAVIVDDGVDAALRTAGERARDFGPLRTRLVGEHEAEAAEIRAALAAVEQALASAREAFLAQKYDAMIAALTSAESAAVAALPAGPLCAATLWEVEFQLGLAFTTRAQAGDDERAGARFALALALDEARRPAPGLYGPDVGLAFVQAVDAAARKPPRPVKISVTPADAEVAVDCRVLPAPTVQAELRPGSHVVRVAAPGHRATASVAAPTDELRGSLVPAADAPLGGWWLRGALDPGSPSARAAVHAFTGAARVVWLEQAEGRHVARLVVDGVVRRVARADTAGDAVVQAVSVAPRSQSSTPSSPPPRRKRVGLWVGLASAALGSVALGLGLGLGLREPSGGRLQLVVQ